MPVRSSPRCRRLAPTCRLIALAVALAVSSCSAPEPPAAIVVGTPFDLEHVNELIVQGSSFNNVIVHQLFLTLVEENPDFSTGPPTFLPRLAESWQLAADRSTLDFALRQDVHWSDGTPVTADDVRFTWLAQTSPDVAWNASDYKKDIEDVEVLDSHTVRFHFDKPSAAQIQIANEGVILPAHAWGELPFAEWRQTPEWFLEHLVVSGPFMLEDWQRQQHLVLRRNDNYFRPGLPKCDSIVFRRIPDSAILIEQFLASEVDLIEISNHDDIDRVQARDDLVLIDYQKRQYDFITWNTLRPFFDDVRVRQALALGIDQQALIDTLGHGLLRPGTSPIVSGVWAHNEDLVPWPHDLERARELLTEAGWLDSDGDGVRERQGIAFRFELSTNPGIPLRWDALQLIAAQLREIGVDAQPTLIEYSKLTAMNFGHDYDATLMALAMDTALNLDLFGTGDAYNFGAYSNAEVDALIEAINSALDLGDVREELLRLQEILHQELPIFVLWEPHGALARNKRVDGVEPNLLWRFGRLEDWSLSTDGAEGGP